MTTLLYPQNPLRQQPRQRIEKFDRTNFYGRHCLFALIPGWDHWYSDAATGNYSGLLTSVGQKRQFVPQGTGASGTATTQQVIEHYGRGVGLARAARFAPQTRSAFVPLNDLHKRNGDYGLTFPDPRSFTVLTIFRPVGNGSNGGDPRIISQDIGSGADDHDLMLGSVGSSNARTRIRLGGQYVNGTDVIDDSK